MLRHVFLHVPKASGSSWINALQVAHGRRAVQTVPGVGWPHEPVDVVDVGSDTVVVAGHVSRATDETFSVRYHTFLRDPVRRVESAHRYLQVTRRNPLHDVASGTDSYEVLLEQGGKEFDNGQLRRLIPRGFDVPESALGREHLDVALEAIRSGEIPVGLTEAFDLSALHVGRQIGIAWPVYWRTNSTQPAQDPVPSHWTTDAEELRRAHPRVTLDAELYEAARTHLASNAEDLPLAEYRRRISRHRRRVAPAMAIRSARSRSRRAMRRGG